MANWDDVIPAEDLEGLRRGRLREAVRLRRAARRARRRRDVQLRRRRRRADPRLDRQVAHLLWQLRLGVDPLHRRADRRSARAGGPDLLHDDGVPRRRVRPRAAPLARLGRRDRRGGVAGGNEVVAEIAPREEDVVIVKPKPSAYFATPLIGHLTYLQADTVIIVGSTNERLRARRRDRHLAVQPARDRPRGVRVGPRRRLAQGQPVRDRAGSTATSGPPPRSSTTSRRCPGARSATAARAPCPPPCPDRR